MMTNWLRFVTCVVFKSSQTIKKFEVLEMFGILCHLFVVRY